ncbi:MAG: hypothetical protein FWE82_10635 [Defluviitaleaceae bacterium]|nr:hypothetical protein [Defluviitaleaceae bacterium]
MIIENGGYFYPVEIKATSDPKKDAANSFRLLKKIPDKKVGCGAVICLSNKTLPLCENVWILPAWNI